MLETTYKIAARGLATSFTDSELPIDYAATMKNCFISQAGGAEERQGIDQFSDPVPGGYTITGLHELVLKDGTTFLFASGGGHLWLYSQSLSRWSDNPVFSFNASTTLIQSVEFTGKLILYNGIDPTVYTTDGAVFHELLPVIERGTATTGTSAQALRDVDLGNIVNTNIANNDVVYYVGLSAYGIITATTSVLAQHTIVGVSGLALGLAAREPTAGDHYVVQDLIELNIIPTPDPGFLDNVAILGTGTTNTVVAVSAFSFIGTDARVGDWVYNTTRAAITRVTAVATALGVGPGITGQVANDSVILLKSALATPTKMHTHFGRVYAIDERDQRTIRFSGPDNAEDWTSGSGTLSISNLQEQGESVLTMTSFQRFFVIGGTRNVYFYSGTDPADATTFLPLGTMPQGVVSPLAMTSIGNEALFASADGIQSVSLVRFATQLGRSPVSNQINTTLRQAIRNNPQSEIIAVHYPRRAWVLFKVGSEMYVLNYQPNLLTQQKNPNALETAELGSWSLFDGRFAQSSCFLVRNNGDLLTGHGAGVIGIFDNNAYDDLGDDVNFVYQTGWLTTTDPKISVKQKQGVYIKPLFEVGAAVAVDITVEAPFERTSTDSATAIAGFKAAPIGIFIVGTNAIGGSGVTNTKLPLYWKGEVFRLKFETRDQVGPFVLSRYTIYSNLLGRI